MLKIAVLVSGGGTNLQALLDAQGGVLRSGSICVVISNNPDAYALQRAKNHNVPACVATTEAQILDALEKYGADLIVLAGFLKILSADFIRRYPQRILNIHPSLIPAFCGKGFYGLKVHQAALDYGVKVTGATVHFVNEVPDGGEIIDQKAVRIRKNDTPQTLQRRVMEQAEWILLPRAAEKVCRQILKKENKK